MASCSVYMDLRVPTTSRIRLWRSKMAAPFTFGSSWVPGKRPWIPLMSFGSPRTFASASTPTVISNYKIYTRLGDCLVVPPTNGLKPRAIVKFLGGAFVGAAPEVTYSHLMYLLAMEGFLVISVPYSVTFDHDKAAREVYERFHACMDMLCVSGLPSAKLSADEINQLPLYSVGHSNGALLQVLAGSYFSEKIPKTNNGVLCSLWKANAIVSFNNRPASEAVPYFEQFGPIMSQMVPLVEASPLYEIVRNASGDAFKTMFDTAGEMIRRYDEEVMVSLSRFLEQLPLVMNQIIQGVSEFTPTPSENRDYFKKFYNVPHTLLVKFNFDAIDETDLLEEVLRPRIESMGGTVEKVVLSGTHITPCVQDVTWQVGDVYTPVDAIAQTLKSLSVNDTKVLARTLSSWFGRFDD